MAHLDVMVIRLPFFKQKERMMQLEGLFIAFPVIETGRLILRQFTPDDAQALFVCISDPDVWRYSRRPVPTSLEWITHHLDTLLKRYQERTMVTWAIVLKENQHVMGKFQMEEWSDEHHHAALGYLLGKQYWGNGYATEALRAVIAYLFEHTTVNRIDAFTWRENVASARVMEKAGMRFEGLARQRYFAKGAFRDLKTYAILREDVLDQKVAKPLFRMDDKKHWEHPGDEGSRPC
jgi:[ribosomal protein S5]-alanine N-acetyltransferase